MKRLDLVKRIALGAALAAFAVFLVVYPLVRAGMQSAWIEKRLHGVSFLVEKTGLESGAVDLGAAADEAFAFLGKCLGRDPGGLLPSDLVVVLAYGGYAGVTLSDEFLERSLRAKNRTLSVRIVESLKSRFAPNEPFSSSRGIKGERLILADLYEVERNGDPLSSVLVHALSDFMLSYNAPPATLAAIEPGAGYSPAAMRRFYLFGEFFSLYLAERSALGGDPAAEGADPGVARLLRERVAARYAPDGALLGEDNLRARYTAERAELGALVRNHFLALDLAESHGEGRLVAVFRAAASGAYSHPEELVARLGLDPALIFAPSPKP